jgi:aryl-alcohol dehydrogenase-like predicted oxidoreductase
MEYTKFGRAGFQTSKLILGTMNFGPQTSEPDAFTIMDKALEMGINHFDTANQYGGDGNWGRTERILGNWFRARGKRQEIVLATKVSANMGDQIGQNGVHAINIKRSCEASLKRLQTDHIDLYIMHHIDRNVHPEEWMQAMEQLVREGKILYVGSSNFPGWNIAQAMELQKRRNFLGLVSEQHLYNLARRAAELEVIPACREYGLALTPYSPLAGGMLAGSRQGAASGQRSTTRLKGLDKSEMATVNRYETLCAEFGQDPAVVGQSWLIHNPHVTAVISGPRVMKQLEDAVKAVQFKLSGEQQDRLESIFPGIRGAAPESYAW